MTGADDPRDRGHIDDRAAALVFHHAHGMFAAEERAVEIDRHQGAPFIERGRFDILEQRHAGTVDENIDPADVTEDVIRDSNPFVFARDVEFVGSGCGFERRRTDIGQDDPGALIGKKLRRRKADPRCAARNQRNLVLHATHDLPPIFVRT